MALSAVVGGTVLAGVDGVEDVVLLARVVVDVGSETAGVVVAMDAWPGSSAEEQAAINRRRRGAILFPADESVVAANWFPFLKPHISPTL